MDKRIVPSDPDFWTRARRHLLKYGGEFVDFVPVRAEGAFLYDDAGRRVLDFTSGQMSAVLGHSHPEIIATVRHRAARPPVLLDAEPACGRSRRAFGPAGAATVQSDAIVYWRRGQRGGYQARETGHRRLGGGGVRAIVHGMTGMAASATYKAGRRGYGPMAMGCFAIPAPNAYRPRFPGVDWQTELNDAFDLLDRQSTGNPPPLIAEPILRRAGVFRLPQRD